MGYIAPLRAEDVPALGGLFEAETARRGFVPNLYLALARNTDLVDGLDGVMNCGLWSGSLTQQHRHLLFAVASAVSGSLYTFSLAGHALQRGGLTGDAVLRVLDDLDGTGLSDERTQISLRFARDMASIPNRTEPEDFEHLRRFYDDAQIVEIAFVVALQGLLHRMSGMLGLELEAEPSAWAIRHLGAGQDLPEVIPRAFPAAPRLGPPDASETGRRLQPLVPDQVPELAEEFLRFADTYVPNSFLVMARRPDLVRVTIGLWSRLLESRTVPSDLAYMASWISSYATGCLYCQAHTSLHAHHSGVDPAKIDDLWSFEQSPLFSQRERTALNLAIAGAGQPSEMSEALARQLHDHFDERGIVDLMFSIANFGFFNRWNDTFVTPLEDQPFEFASEHLASSGWDGRRHRNDPPGRALVAASPNDELRG